MQKEFYHEIEVVNDGKDVKVTAYRLLFSGPTYMKDVLIISRYSINSLIDMLMDPNYIMKWQKGDILNKFDHIELFYGGSDDRPIIQIGNLRVEITKNDNDVSSIAIPVDFLNREYETYLFIKPLVEDLKKYAE